jgi:Putative prokaryotic signal transducing protein
MKRLYTAAHLPEAHLVRGLLAVRGIPVRIFNEYAQGGLGDLPAASVLPELWLEDERDEGIAREIVNTYERQATLTGVQACPNCGEENPRDFAVCWQCQKPM